MPLGPTGEKVRAEMQDRYGATKGKAVFYAKENKDPKFAKAMKSKAPASKRSTRGKR